MGATLSMCPLYQPWVFDLQLHKEMHIRIFIVKLFVILRSWRQLKSMD